MKQYAINFEVNMALTFKDKSAAAILLKHHFDSIELDDREKLLNLVGCNSASHKGRQDIGVNAFFGRRRKS